jgi:hypothetical protein
MNTTSVRQGIAAKGRASDPSEYLDGGVTPRFRWIAGVSAVFAALVGEVYTVTFAIYVKRGYRWAHWSSAVAALIGGLVVVPVLVAVHARLRNREAQIAGIAFGIGIVGALGATIHSGFDIALLAHPLAGIDANAPSAIDPRGLLTFVFAGAALGLFGLLALSGGGLPRRCAQTGVAAAVVLLVVYLGRLIALNPNNNVIRVSALVAGLVVVPAFYLQVARLLLRPSEQVAA